MDKERVDLMKDTEHEIERIVSTDINKERNIISSMSALMRKLNYLDQLPYEYVEGEKLYPAEIHSIEIIGLYKELNQTEIAEKLGVTKGAVSRMSKRLEAKKLAEKRRRPDNKKDIYLCLTKRGQEIFEYHSNYHKKMDAYFIEQLSAMSDEEKAGAMKLIGMASAYVDSVVDKMN